MAVQSYNAEQADRSLAGAHGETRAWRAGLPTLVRLAQSGEHAAFEALYRRYRALVLRVCGLRMAGDAEAAEELAATAWERAYRHLARFDPDTNFSAWVCKIAVNACRDELQRSQIIRIVRERPADEWALMNGQTGSAPAAGHASRTDNQIDPAPGPEDLLLAAERQRELQAVWRTLETMKPLPRRALVLQIVEGMRPAEICAELGVSHSSLKSMLWRARGTFRARWLGKTTAPRRLRGPQFLWSSEMRAELARHLAAGLTYEQIGLRMGRSQSSVNNAVQRMRQRARGQEVMAGD